MRRLLITAALAVLPAAVVATTAHAQRMDCYGVEGGRQVCTTARAELFDDISRRVEPRAAAQAQAPAVADTPAPFVTPEQRRLVQAVARAVLAGRCDKARERAIAAGDLDLASAAVVQCEARLAERARPAGPKS